MVKARKAEMILGKPLDSVVSDDDTIVCVIFSIANRIPAFRFGVSNLTLSQILPIRYLFLSFVTHHCNTYNGRFFEKRLIIEKNRVILYG